MSDRRTCDLNGDARGTASAARPALCLSVRARRALQRRWCPCRRRVGCRCVREVVDGCWRVIFVVDLFCAYYADCVALQTGNTIVLFSYPTVSTNTIPHCDAECLRQDVSSLLRKSRPPKQNMTRQELTAVHNLRNDEDLIVLPADKGNATVVVGTVGYENKVIKLLSDPTTYKKVTYNPTARVTTKTIKLLQDLNDPELASRLRPHNPTPPKIYGLPKIHKLDWPLRPIVSQIDAPTYKLSQHLATMLQPFTGKTASYIKDSRHLVSLLSDVKLRHTEIMVSFDITSLFTNVPVEETINIIASLLNDSDVPTGYIECIKFCLESGYFLWRGEYYLQVDGVLMESPLAPVVANIFMEWFESQALGTSQQRPRYWWRYVDDNVEVVAPPDSSNGKSLEQSSSMSSKLGISWQGTPPSTCKFWALSKATLRNFCQPSLPPLHMGNDSLAHTAKEKADLLLDMCTKY